MLHFYAKTLKLTPKVQPFEQGYHLPHLCQLNKKTVLLFYFTMSLFLRFFYMNWTSIDYVMLL